MEIVSDLIKSYSKILSSYDLLHKFHNHLFLLNETGDRIKLITDKVKSFLIKDHKAKLRIIKFIITLRSFMNSLSAEDSLNFNFLKQLLSILHTRTMPAFKLQNKKDNDIEILHKIFNSKWNKLGMYSYQEDQYFGSEFIIFLFKMQRDNNIIDYTLKYSEIITIINKQFFIPIIVFNLLINSLLKKCNTNNHSEKLLNTKFYRKELNNAHVYKSFEKLVFLIFDNYDIYSNIPNRCLFFLYLHLQNKLKIVKSLHDSQEIAELQLLSNINDYLLYSNYKGNDINTGILNIIQLINDKQNYPNTFYRLDLSFFAYRKTILSEKLSFEDKVSFECKEFKICYIQNSIRVTINHIFNGIDNYSNSKAWRTNLIIQKDNNTLNLLDKNKVLESFDIDESKYHILQYIFLEDNIINNILDHLKCLKEKTDLSSYQIAGLNNESIEISVKIKGALHILFNGYNKSLYLVYFIRKLIEYFPEEKVFLHFTEYSTIKIDSSILISLLKLMNLPNVHYIYNINFDLNPIKLISSINSNKISILVNNNVSKNYEKFESLARKHHIIFEYIYIFNQSLAKSSSPKYHNIANKVINLNYSRHKIIEYCLNFNECLTVMHPARIYKGVKVNNNFYVFLKIIKMNFKKLNRNTILHLISQFMARRLYHICDFN